MMNQSVATDKPMAVIASSTCTDGYNLARQFAENGYDIIVAAANPSVVEEAEDLKKLKVDAVSFQLDLSSPEGIEQLYRRIVATGRPVEALIINTGLSRNLEQETLLAKKVLHDMTDRGYGKIIFVSSEIDDQRSAIRLQDFFAEAAKGTGIEVSAQAPDEDFREKFQEDKKESLSLLH